MTKPPPFGETPKERATYLMWAFSGMINVALLHCQSCIQADITPSFYEKVKIELKNNENKFGSSKIITTFVKVKALCGAI